MSVADIDNIEDDFEEDVKTFESGPAPDIWSWGLVAGKERYLPHLRRRDRLYLVKDHQPVITLSLETSEHNHLVTSGPERQHLSKIQSV